MHINEKPFGEQRTHTVVLLWGREAPPQEHVLPMDDTPVQEDGEAELQMVAVKPKATGGLGGSLSETQNGDVSEETVGGGKVKKKNP